MCHPVRLACAAASVSVALPDDTALLPTQSRQKTMAWILAAPSARCCRCWRLREPPNATGRICRWLLAARVSAGCGHSVQPVVFAFLAALCLLPALALTNRVSFSSGTSSCQVGDLVYARVESAHRDLEPVLSCMDAAGKVSRRKVVNRGKHASVWHVCGGHVATLMKPGTKAGTAGAADAGAWPLALPPSPGTGRGLCAPEGRHAV